ncbi:hypothetical protein K2F54_06355 [Cryobacterium sp. 1639]|uniref:baeRF3 domain-containing protein n=1 Tax=Cryobacterium inferilacus TaxID=2866629 RepID=UPI001C72CD5C|nr:hypothetical protein [Cryobacterium sp. 1639]MBX0299596.1 hypothetical protein [Cryobacterium sp. 1639]
MTSESPSAVSIFLQTHPTGKEVRQDPIRLKNLLADARTKLTRTSLTEAEADALLQPATDLLEDREFWQHRSTGLALFIGQDQLDDFHVPLDFEDRVVVGHAFDVRPLLPLLTADGQFRVLTVTSESARLYTGSRHDLVLDTTAGLPERASVENDYENPVQASPPARPRVGSANISNAQVYGDGPPDFRKALLQEFVGAVAKAVDKLNAADPQPLVLVADAEVGGHFQHDAHLGSMLIGVVHTNPASLDVRELHDLAYPEAKSRLDSGRVDAIAKAAELLGRGDQGATSVLPDIVRAAYRGQVDTLLLGEGEPVWGRYDLDADRLETGPAFEASGEDLWASAAVQTLQHGGSVHLTKPDELPDQAAAVALLRF